MEKGLIEQMKKINTKLSYALCFALACAFSSCGRTQSATGEESEIVTTGSASYYSVSAVDYYEGGMHYKVFNSAQGDVFVVNITKDSMLVNAR